MALARSSLLFVAGGDCFAKYSTLTRRLQIPTRRGEDGAEVFTRATPGWSVGAGGLLTRAAINAPRVEYIGGQPYYLGETSATNVALRNRDCANAAWTKTTCTAVRDQVGADGVANAASSLLATAGNATCLQAITLGSSARFQTVYVKRLVGAGTVQMTMDNGATWTAIAVTAAYVPVSIPTQTLPNPTVGFRLVTNGDKIAVDFVQNETGTFATSPIETTTVAVTRATDFCAAPFPIRPQFGMWVYSRHGERGTALLSTATGLWCLGSGANAWQLIGSSAYPGYLSEFWNGGNQGVGAMGHVPVFGDSVESFLVVTPAGNLSHFQRVNGGTIFSVGPAAITVPPTWGTPILSLLVDRAGASPGYGAVGVLKVGLGGGTLINTMDDAAAVPI
jgi:hypothetical protein